MKDFSNNWNAISFAFIKYVGLKRKENDITYVIHPIRITKILNELPDSVTSLENIKIYPDGSGEFAFTKDKK